jgi:hypothetical protein
MALELGRITLLGHQYYHMIKIPTSLQMVACFFLLSGVSASVGMCVQIVSGTLVFDMGLLGIPTYFGLRRLSPGWRKCAILSLVLGLVAWPAGVAFGLIARSPAHVAIFGVRLGDISPHWLVVVSATMFLMVLWQIHTLTRPEIRTLFVHRDEAGHA